MSGINGITWVFSAIMAVVFLVVGITKAFGYKKAVDAFVWVKDVPRGLVQSIGVAEILAALGLILPVATGIYPWLTPVAALGLALLLFMSISFHVQRHERDQVAVNVLLLLLVGFVAYGRWSLTSQLPFMP